MNRSPTGTANVRCAAPNVSGDYAQPESAVGSGA